MIDKKARIAIGFIIIFIFGLLAINVYQYKQIKNLQTRLSILDETKVSHSNCYVNYQDDTFNYLAIGNSITVHTKCDYWWSQCGMAASTAEADFYHLMIKGLEEKYGPVTSSVCNIATWEMLETDRAEAADLLIPYLSDKIDLITLQLGDNVNNSTSFETDFEYLVTYIKEKAPNAKIVIVGDFWKKSNKDEVKEKVAIAKKCIFVSLSEIQGNEDYMRKTGDVVYDDDGSEHIVNHNGVIKHPNDKGMEYIADNILKSL